MNRIHPKLINPQNSSELLELYTVLSKKSCYEVEIYSIFHSGTMR